MESMSWTRPADARRHFIGGSDARIIMGNDEAALIRLWREKRGEVDWPNRSRRHHSHQTNLPSSIAVELGD
jgi:predicted phage-related endonuclease